MVLPTGLLPGFVFALTVGVASLVTLGAALSWSFGIHPFSAALRTALAGVSFLYPVGTVLVWSVVGGGSSWGVVATLLVAGVGSFVGMGMLPLVVGQQLVRRLRGADSETALQFATYGWPLAMLVVFGIFVAPGGLGRGHLLHLDGAQTCLVGFCGVSRSLVGAVALEGAVVVFGPGLLGAGLAASAETTPSLVSR